MHLSGSLFFACAADHATWRRFRKYAIIRKDNLPFPFNPVDDGPLTDLSTYGHWKSNESRDLRLPFTFRADLKAQPISFGVLQKPASAQKGQP